MTKSNKVRALKSKPRSSKVATEVAPRGKLTRSEIGTDDVIRELRNLFVGLCLEPGQLASRVRRVDHLAKTRVRQSHHASVIGDLLTIWNQDPDFLDGSGNPIPIRMSGRGKSFSELALRCAPNMNAHKILLDLQRLGAVLVDKDGLIHALGRSIPVYEDKRLAAKHTLAMRRCRPMKFRWRPRLAATKSIGHADPLKPCAQSRGLWQRWIPRAIDSRRRRGFERRCWVEDGQGQRGRRSQSRVTRQAGQFSRN